MADKKEVGAPKAEQYKEYKKRFGRALRAECFLECVFIDYAMMEDRLLSILHHLNIADRERGDGRGWARSPKAKRAGYKNALRTMPKLRKDGSLPNIDSIGVKIEVLKTLAILETSDCCCNDYERWLRTEVRKKLVDYGTAELCNDVSRWVHHRNDLSHALFGIRSRDYDADSIRVLAEEGIKLATRLDDIAGCMARLMARFEKGRIAQARKLLRHDQVKMANNGTSAQNE